MNDAKKILATEATALCHGRAAAAAARRTAQAVFEEGGSADLDRDGAVKLGAGRKRRVLVRPG